MTTTLTIKRAAELARPLGYTIRRTQDSELVGYKKGTGQDAPAAYFSDCPLDVLATVAAMAAQDGAPQSALDAAAAACGVQITRAEPLAEIVQESERMAANSGPDLDNATTVDLTPTWAGLAPAFFAVMESGTYEGQQTVRAELTRALTALDAHNAAAKAAQDDEPAAPYGDSDFERARVLDAVNAAYDRDDVGPDARAELAAMTRLTVRGFQDYADNAG